MEEEERVFSKRGLLERKISGESVGQRGALSWIRKMGGRGVVVVSAHVLPSPILSPLLFLS